MRPAPLIGAVLGTGGAFLTARGWLMHAFDGFDLLDGAHWGWLWQGLESWWDGGGGPRSDFLLGLAAAFAAPPVGLAAGALLGHLSAPLAASIAAAVRRFRERRRGVDGEADPRPGRFQRLRDLFRRKPKVRVPAGKSVASPGRRSFHFEMHFGWDEGEPARSGQTVMPRASDAPPLPPLEIGAPLSAIASDVRDPALRADVRDPALRAEADVRTEPDVRKDSDDRDEEAFLEERIEAMTDNDIRGRIAIWLADRGWEVRPDIRVNADAGGAGISGLGASHAGGAMGAMTPDRFDDDPNARIPLVAIAPDEIALVFPAALKGKAWFAPAFDPEREGIPMWADETGEGSLPCPFSTALRALQRFNDHHRDELANFGSVLVSAYVVVDAGEILTLDDIIDSWSNVEVAITHLDADNALEYAFGEPVEPIPADMAPLVQRIVGHSNELAKMARKRAA